MQVQDTDTQLLFGLFQGICTWAMDRGYRDISGMKSLLKLAMVDSCRQVHDDKASFAAQMAIVADLGISLRNVQYSLKKLEDLGDISADFVRIREIQKEIAIILGNKPMTSDEIVAELSYLIHAPYELQKRAINTFLEDMEKKGLLASTTSNGNRYFQTKESHVNLYKTSDLPTRVAGTLEHINNYNHTVGVPLLRFYTLKLEKARKLQLAINGFLKGTGTACEVDCKANKKTTKPFYFYYGSTTVKEENSNLPLQEAMLSVIYDRYNDPESASILRSHWYHLTRVQAEKVFRDVSDFIRNESQITAHESQDSDSKPYCIYFGLSDRHHANNTQEI